MDLSKLKNYFLFFVICNLIDYCICTDIVDCSSCIDSPSSCKDKDYCFDAIDATSKVIKALNNEGKVGPTKFGKSGTSSGNYFFNNDSKLITSDAEDNVITSGYSCNSSGCKSIDSKSYINSKATGLLCAYILDSKCKTALANESYYDTFSEKVIKCSSNKCSLTSENGYYVDSGKYTNQGKYLITCKNNVCKSEEYTGNNVHFLLNAGMEKSSKPIIYFDTNSYKAIPGDPSVAYLDYSIYSATDPSTITDIITTNLIVCFSENSCSSKSYNSGVFLSSAKSLSDSNQKQLIQCDTNGCKEMDDSTIENYKGTNSDNIYYIDELSKKLISCTTGSLSCEISSKDTSNKFYLDYSTLASSTLCSTNNKISGGSESFCSTNIISCDSSSKCKSISVVSDSNFIDGDTNENLIICSTFGDVFFCTAVLAEKLQYYYINSGNTSDYPLLYCGEDDQTKTCVEKKASTDGYYLTDNGNTIKEAPYSLNNIGYLISCSSESKCEKSSDIANKGYYVNAGALITSKPLIYFENESPSNIEMSPKARDTFYLDSSSLLSNTYSNLIYCSTIKDCASINPEDGYYFNANTENKDSDAIIICDKTGCTTGETNTQYCIVDVATMLYPGNYCFQKLNGDDEDLNFVINEFVIDSEEIDVNNQNITYVSSGSSSYHFVTVNSGNFPGISSPTSTLFEVKSNAITRVVQDGVFVINSKHEKVETMSGSITIGAIYSVYVCTSASQLCTQTLSCQTGTYLFDEDSGKGYLCNGNSIVPISEEGYYLDSSYVVNKSFTPAVLKCNGIGECQRYTPTDTYFINSGIDSDTKALIHCSTRTCTTTEGAVGYYKAEFGESGVIVCTSNTNCKISSLRYSYYINSGADKVSKPIIGCTNNTNCDTKKAVAGYYLVQENNNILINCKSSITCEVTEASVGYYYNSANSENTLDSETIIKCYTSSYTASVVCSTERTNEGFYLSGSETNVLVNCMGSKCKSITVENGIFRSAGSVKTSVKNDLRDKYIEEEEEWIDRVGRTYDEQENLEKEGNVMLRMSEKPLFNKRAPSTSTESVSSLISCSGNVCSELTAEELKLIPVCTYNSDVCYLDNSGTSSTSNNIITSVVAGEFCTDASRSTLYFATETIVEYNDVISGVLSTSKTTTKNCIKASSQYSSNLFTVGNSIYKVNDGLIVQVYDPGYYFINIKKNILVYGTEIKEYNNSNVLLYKCDGTACRIMDKPTSNTYYTDVTKRILKYNVEDDKYSFINKKENICVFENNTCTPKYDIEENDFCITADGHIVVVGEKIKSRETGKCFMSYSISDNVLAYSYNSVLYLLNSNAAKQVVTSGYYFAENNKYYSAEYKSFNSTSTGITLYGCINNICQIYEPQPDVYYFDMLTNYLIQKKGRDWISPIKVGHIYVSISPEETYIYSYTMSDTKELLLTKTNKSGYYYTIDKKMYYCEASLKTCKEIEDSAYILTNNNEFYYCVVDSEGEETECFKRICTTGQVYYIKNDYYRCTSGSFLELVRSRTCNHEEIVVINFPLIYSQTFPIDVYNSISNIAKNNHYVPTHKTSRSSIESFQGVFTNCTYDAYDEDAKYDQICMQNYVKLNQDKEPDICSVKVLGYTYCTVDDGDNEDKCNPSSAFSQKYLSSWHIFKIIISLIIIFIIY